MTNDYLEYDDYGTEGEDEFVGCKHDFEEVSEYVEECQSCGYTRQI